MGPLVFLGHAQDAGERTGEVDAQLAIHRRQQDRVDQGANLLDRLGRMDWVLQRAVQIGDLATIEFVRVGWSRGCASGARAISCASCSCRCSSAISMSLRRRAGTPFGDRIDDAPDTLLDRVSLALHLLGLGTLVSARPVDLGHELLSEDLSRFARMPVVGSWVEDKKGMWFLIASLVDLSVGLAFGSLAHSHGAVDWIRQNADAEFSCGQQDCTPLASRRRYPSFDRRPSAERGVASGDRQHPTW